MPVDTKRKRSLRESTTRSGHKRHESVKGVAKSVTPVQSSRSESRQETPEIKEEEVPTAFDEKGPLPTSRDLQKEATLPPREWKTIAESAVLQTAFDRSRDVWLSGRMFERYWTKPTKKKIVDEKNPPKDSMVKIGECMLSIQPHVFEVKLYSVRDREKERLRDLEFQQQQELYQAQLAQNPKYSHPGRPTNSAKAALQFKSTPHQNGQTLPRQMHPNQSNGTSSPTTPQQNNPDPVIQLLATRASNDSHLKALMRIVASGQANAEQLKLFQSHIDELTPLARASAAAKAQRASLAPQSPSPAVQPKIGAAVGPLPVPQTAPVSEHNPQPIQPAVQSQQPITPKPQTPSVLIYQKPKQLSVADRKHLDIRDVVFEFTISICGDRFLIPRHSIIEYRSNGTELLLSYLYISEVDKTFQPITVKFNAPNPKYLEPISRVVETPENTRKYMSDIMETYTRADNGYLLMRLKRDQQEIIAAQEAEARRLKEEEEVKKRLAKAATAAVAAAEDLYQDILRPDAAKSGTSMVKAKSKKSVSTIRASRVGKSRSSLLRR